MVLRVEDEEAVLALVVDSVLAVDCVVLVAVETDVWLVAVLVLRLDTDVVLGLLTDVSEVAVETLVVLAVEGLEAVDAVLTVV